MNQIVAQHVVEDFEASLGRLVDAWTNPATKSHVEAEHNRIILALCTLPIVQFQLLISEQAGPALRQSILRAQLEKSVKVAHEHA